MRNLTKIYLEGIPLVGFPRAFNLLTNLRQLTLIQMHLTDLPSSFATLINLEKLNLAQNQISQIPLAIFKLPKVRWLNLSYNKIEHIPAESQIIKLEFLALEANPLHNLDWVEKIIPYLGNLNVVNINIPQVEKLSFVLNAKSINHYIQIKY